MRDPSMERYLPPQRYCEATSKPIYDKKTAQTAANRRYKFAKVKLRIYQCPDCNGWHLTHVMHYIPNGGYGKPSHGRGRMKRW